MLNQQIAEKILNCSREYGADFCDIYVEKKNSNVLNFIDQKVKDIQGGLSFGIGVRAVFGTKVLYAYSNSAEEEDLIQLTQKLCALEKSTPKSGDFNFQNLQKTKPNEQFLTLEKGPFLDEKVAYARLLDSKARQSELIKQVNIAVIQSTKDIQVFNSDGLAIEDHRNYIRLAHTVIAAEGNEQMSAFLGPGAMQGWEFHKSLDPAQVAEDLTKSAITMLKAEACPAGKMPVVIDSGFGGVIFHEACGHLLETTSVEKKASVFHDKMGEMIAHSAVSAVDDGTIENSWGSIAYDDEGMEAQKTQLIKDGKLVNFLVDRVGHLKTGHPRSGSGRKQSYKFAPASRMRNTFIEAGPHSREEILTSVSDGLYAKKMGGGSVNPGTGEFNFSVEEGYLIKNGKIDKPVRGATLIGTGPEILKQISMVGNNFALSAGMCGSVSGSVPVTVGQPAIKVDDILVGGKA